MCGWKRFANGQLYEESTGTPESSFTTFSCGPRKKKKGKISKVVRAQMMQIPCYFCGGKSDTMDHLLALSRGGSNRRSNLVSACHECNMIKSGMMYEELISFCHKMVAKYRERPWVGPKKRFRAEQCIKIIAWHEARLKAKQLVPVV